MRSGTVQVRLASLSYTRSDEHNSFSGCFAPNCEGEGPHRSLRGLKSGVALLVWGERVTPTATLSYAFSLYNLLNMRWAQKANLIQNALGPEKKKNYPSLFRGRRTWPTCARVLVLVE